MSEGNDTRNLEDVTDMIYDTLMKNTKYPQLPETKDQWVDSGTGTIHIMFDNDVTYRMTITEV